MLKFQSWWLVFFFIYYSMWLVQDTIDTVSTIQCFKFRRLTIRYIRIFVWQLFHFLLFEIVFMQTEICESIHLSGETNIVLYCYVSCVSLSCSVNFQLSTTYFQQKCLTAFSWHRCTTICLNQNIRNFQLIKILLLSFGRYHFRVL